MILMSRWLLTVSSLNSLNSKNCAQIMMTLTILAQAQDPLAEVMRALQRKNLLLGMTPQGTKVLLLPHKPRSSRLEHCGLRARMK
jgi:hypothetical protein